MSNALKGTIPQRGSVKGAIGVLEKIQGRSAYEVAVINGFEGTEEEWLHSLKGAKGEQGEQGTSIRVRYDEETKTLFITSNDNECAHENTITTYTYMGNGGHSYKTVCTECGEVIREGEKKCSPGPDAPGVCYECGAEYPGRG